MNAKIKLLVFSLPFLFQACVKENASDVNQDRIYVEYELFYNKNTDMTTAGAHFKFGSAVGTTLQLDSTATVTFNGELLPYNAVLGRHQKDYAGQLQPGTFVYTNIDGDVFTNTTPVMKPIAYPPIDTVHRNAAFTLTWVGDPLAAGESVGLAVNETNELTSELFATAALGATSLVLPKNQLQKLDLGSTTWFMDRAHTQTLTEGTSAGGTNTAKYRAQNITVQLVD